jgi:ABC-type uncharacterized transport system ATPase subunit
MREADLAAAAAVAGTLSGGMLQRLLGVREFAENPKFVIMAEPAWGLDHKRKSRFYRFLRSKAEDGCAILLFYSDIDELLAICDRILALHNGKSAGIFTVSEEKDIKTTLKNAISVGTKEEFNHQPHERHEHNI